MTRKPPIADTPYAIDVDVKRGTLRARPISIAEADAAPFIMCMRWHEPLAREDNVSALCAGCGMRLQHRPNVPARPMKVCPACAQTWTTATRH